MLLSYILNGHLTKYQCFIDTLKTASVTAWSIEVYHNDLMRKERYRTNFWKLACGASFFLGRLNSLPTGLWSMLRRICILVLCPAQPVTWGAIIKSGLISS